MSDVRYRSLELTSASVDDRGGKPTLVGVTAPYGVLSSQIRENGMVFRERIRAGAFNKSLASKNIEALLEHNKHWLLGTKDSGTLRLRSEADGIHFEIDLPDTSYARDLIELAKRGEVKGASFGYRPVPGGETIIRERSGAILEVSEGDLSEITITARPRYQTGTSAYLRSIDASAAISALERSKRLCSFFTLRHPPRS